MVWECKQLAQFGMFFKIIFAVRENDKTETIQGKKKKILSNLLNFFKKSEEQISLG